MKYFLPVKTVAPAIESVFALDSDDDDDGGETAFNEEPWRRRSPLHPCVFHLIDCSPPVSSPRERRRRVKSHSRDARTFPRRAAPHSASRSTAPHRLPPSYTPTRRSDEPPTRTYVCARARVSLAEKYERISPYDSPRPPTSDTEAAGSPTSSIHIHRSSLLLSGT